MLEKASQGRDAFFGLQKVGERPNSVATEFMESDWEMDDEDESGSIIEDDHEQQDGSGDNSPRLSLNSVSREPSGP
jgi:hypothetical protein